MAQGNRQGLIAGLIVLIVLGGILLRLLTQDPSKSDPMGATDRLTSPTLAPPTDAPAPEPPVPPAPNRPYVSDLSAFFDEVDRTYPFFDLKGIRAEWAERKPQWLKQVTECQSDTEFLEILLSAIRCLRDSHIQITDARATHPAPPIRYYPGLSFIVTHDRHVAVLFTADPYQNALPVGTSVETINGIPAMTWLEARGAEAWSEGGSSSYQRADFFACRLPLSGPEGTTFKLGIEGDKGRETVTVQATLPLSGWPHNYHLPDKLIQVGRSFHYAPLDSGVGYMYLRRVDASIPQGIQSATAALLDVRGWIVDLRGNGGGGYDQTLIERISALKRPVAAIIDAGCASAGETLARDLRRYAQAKLFGTPSAGTSSSKRAWTLPSGFATIRLPTSSRWRADGLPIEFNGIEPDAIVRPTLDDLRNGRNTELILAEAWVLEHAQATERRATTAPQPTPAETDPAAYGEPAIIKGILYDTTGEMPLTDYTLTVHRVYLESDARLILHPPVELGFTTEPGAFQIEQVPPGRAVLDLQWKGYRQWFAVPMTPGETVTTSYTLQRPCILEGPAYLKTDSGEERPLTVEVFHEETGDRLETIRTDMMGFYRSYALPAGDHLVRASLPPSIFWSRPVRLEQGKTRQESFVIESPGAIKGTIQWTNNDTASAIVLLRRPGMRTAPDVTARSRTFDDGVFCRSEVWQSGGTVRLSNIPAGEWELIAWGKSTDPSLPFNQRPRCRKVITIQKSETQQVDLTLTAE